MKNILITGADGFIGRALSLFLASKGFTVRGQVVDGKNQAFVQDALKSGIEIVATGDLRQYENWRELFDKQEAVIHLAAKVSSMTKDVQRSLDDYRSVNVTLTEKIAREAFSSGLKKMLFISTVKVNGEQSLPDSGFREADAPKPQDAYGQSKFEAEEVLKSVSRETGLPFVILRLPLVYGPGVRANFLKLIRIVGKGVPLPLKNIKNRRSMIYLENLMDVIKLCLLSPEASGETFLVSDLEDISTADLLRMIAKQLNITPKLFPFPERVLRFLGKLSGKDQEIERLVGSLTVDTSKIRSLLKWKSPFSVETGIKKTIDWYNNIN